MKGKETNNLRCPSCERELGEKPRGWLYYLFLLSFQGALGTFLAITILSPWPGEISRCLRQVSASNAGSCYPPPEPWLAIGWALYAAAIVGLTVWLNHERTTGILIRDKWARTKALIEAQQ